MEIVAKISQKSKIEYNQQEIEKGLSLLESKYMNLTFTEEQVKEAKSERATINKLASNLKDYRKSIIEEAMADIKPFEDFMKEAEKRAEAISKDIDKQVKAFEEQEKIQRFAKVVEYLENFLQDNPKYLEFKADLEPNMDNALFTNKGSFGTTGEAGSKIVDYYNNEFSKLDEILTAREQQEKLLQEKRELIINTCKSTSEMLELKMPLSPKQFAYLKDYSLSDINLEIQRAGQEQATKEREAIEKMMKEAEEKARIEQEKKNQEAEKELEKEEEPKEEEQEQEQEKPTKQEKKQTPKFWSGTVQFNKITLEQAKAFKKFLVESNIKYTTTKQELI